MLMEQSIQSVDQGAGKGLVSWRGCSLINCASTKQLDLSCNLFSGFDKIAGVARVENGQDVAFHLLILQLLFCFVPICPSILEEAAASGTSRS